MDTVDSESCLENIFFLMENFNILSLFNLLFFISLFIIVIIRSFKQHLVASTTKKRKLIICFNEREKREKKNFHPINFLSENIFSLLLNQ